MLFNYNIFTIVKIKAFNSFQFKIAFKLGKVVVCVNICKILNIIFDQVDGGSVCFLLLKIFLTFPIMYEC